MDTRGADRPPNIFCFLVFTLLPYVTADLTGTVHRGLFPTIHNLATTAEITVNATCGLAGPEVFCKLVEHNYLREPQCSVCDSSEPNKRHPISNAIDGTNRWWQSPSLQNGKHFQWVTITLDLRQVYQVAYVIVKSAISPRPGNWILEKSVDGTNYQPWQYFAISDAGCWELYGIRPTLGGKPPRFRTDDEVICTSHYSKLNPLEGGEIHTSLVNGRPGADGPTEALKEFTKARYVRLRLQKIRTLNADLMTMESSDHIDKSVTRRYFYSIKDISIGGQCICNGHAKDCTSNTTSPRQRCRCEHNTCGDHCDGCCPLFNQKLWKPGTNMEGFQCEECQCYGHADKCVFEQSVADAKSSINVHGVYEGGGVCSGCKHHTEGINCERCADRYYRPSGVRLDDPRPCRKCQCTGPGMSGLCVPDDKHMHEGLHPGQCLCRPGYKGRRCDQCDVGYRNYPRCEACFCDPKGTAYPYTCLGPCKCKANVEGERCDKCKAGHYDLAANNPDGCSSCFCFGVTNRCVEGTWGTNITQSMYRWKVTNLEGTRRISPLAYDDTLHIANDDMASGDTYFWEAPPEYLGKKLYAYGGELHFTISYIVDRGDTSGVYIEDADVIFEGSNGVRLGYNWAIRPGETGGDEGGEGERLVIDMPLREHNWYVMNPNGGRTPVSRETFANTLLSLSRLLVRAKFHTDQIEGVLYNVGMEEAAKDSLSVRMMTGVEKCFCPPGYTGLSCEDCTPDYRRVNTSQGSFICEPCDCNSHAESCDGEGRCINCLHHTVGAKCDRCLPGYSGNAKAGAPGDCKRCACPLEVESNNFSPSCTTITTPSGEEDYICTACPAGYGGSKCETCVEGYFGSPQVPGSFCQPCDCSGNVNTSLADYCDRTSGRCLHCIGHTTGWTCSECLPGHYGSATHHSCRLCDCNSYGSEGTDCDPVSGQCFCKENYVGRTCSRCQEGYGNVEAGCVPCWCNRAGSQSEHCDPVSGQCPCKPGVFGSKCDSCLPGHYGFSEEGCRLCDCHPRGALSPECDETTGQCQCHPHVTRRPCDRCEPGYWNLDSGEGCSPCHCNATGSLSMMCDETSGQCPCKPGIGGKHCDHCLPGWYGLTPHGCRKCDPCDATGHICDPTNGRCVCPPHTTGDRCQYCQPTAWGYHPTEGCKPCECNPRGSQNQQCDQSTGECICLEGFEGRHCDRCRHGFYQFPHCQRCECDPQGTNMTLCDLTGHCQCDERGQCPCKPNVVGNRCDRCKDGAFGLSVDNRRGCYECFCFGRSQSCEQANLAWSHEVTMGSREVTMDVGVEEIATVYGYQVIPGHTGSVSMAVPYVLEQPLYWSTPRDFLGDKISTYNGRLHFRLDTSADSQFPSTMLNRYPLVVMQGNHRIILIHKPAEIPNDGRYVVRIHEDDWQQAENIHLPVTRTMMMVALQNLQHLLIRGTVGPEVRRARLYDVSMELAVSTPKFTPSLASGVEACSCPPQYVGLSCQDPAPGYYRKYKPNYLDSKDVLDLVGWAEPCDCNNRSRECDREIGICYNCTDNSSGPHCELCSKGFYEDVIRKRCLPCSCPLPNNRFSETCRPDTLDYVCVDCEQGYTGRHCERCQDGYYGNPTIPGSQCLACDCDAYGSRGRICDKVTGQCQCIDGTSGRDCSRCLHRHILTESGCKSCEDDCTGLLFLDLDDLSHQLNGINLSNLSAIPWNYLLHLDSMADSLRVRVDTYSNKMDRARALANNYSLLFDLETQADMLYAQARETLGQAPLVAIDAYETFEDAKELLEMIRKLRQQLFDVVEELAKHGLDPHQDHKLATDHILDEAERILRELQSRDFTPYRLNAEKELRAAEDLMDSLQKLTRDRIKVDQTSERITRLEKLLEEFVRLLEVHVRIPLDDAKVRISQGRYLHDNILEIIKKILKLEGATNATLKEADEILAEARNFDIDAAIKFEFLPRLVKELENSTEALEQHRGILARLNPEYYERHVLPAQRHADTLHEQAAQLARLFNATREVSEFPLRAAKIYQNIIDALDAAEKAAKRASLAADLAHKEAFPTADDALTDQARKARQRSQELLEKARKLSDEDVPVLRATLEGKKRELNKVAESLALGGRNLDIINRELDALPKDLEGTLREIGSKAQEAVSRSNTAHQKIDDINSRIHSSLRVHLEALGAGTVAGMENLTRIIEQARADIRESSRRAERGESAASRLAAKHQQFQLDLQGLRNKILMARQKAASIRVSITPDAVGQCLRSYQSRFEPSTTNNIVINFAIETHQTDSLLLFAGSATTDDFMAVEMFNRKIRFIWNSGGGVQVLEHPRHISTNDRQFAKNDRWYKIEITRFGNVALLSVKKTPDGQKEDPLQVTGAAPTGWSRMDLDLDSHVYVGGLPPGFQPPAEIKTRSFAGCLYELVLDGKHVGLWNFRTNFGCDGCKEGAMEWLDISAYQFSGDGYAILPQIKRYNKNYYMVAFWFKSLDEDAMLFLSPNTVNGDLVSLQLRGGHVVYELNLGDNSRLVLRTRHRYNTGQWVQVAGARERQQGQLLVDEEMVEGQLPPRGSSSLDIQTNNLYYGGVPPNFTIDSWPSLTFQKFYGCMKDIQIDTTPVNLLQYSSYGINPGCNDRGLKSALFRGTGFLELKGQPLSHEASFGFSFLTTQEDALLLLSTFEGRRAPEDKRKHYYSVSLIGGNIEIRCSTGSGESVVTSERITVNDGRYHTLLVIRKNRKLTLILDDVEVTHIRVPRISKEIAAPSDGGLFLGGVRPGMNVGQMAASHASFSGTIKDCIFNDKLVTFNILTSQSGVKIGRADVEQPRNITISTATIISQGPDELQQQLVSHPEAEVCHPAPTYHLERRALNFGSSHKSYLRLPVGRGQLSADFNLTLKLRVGNGQDGVILAVGSGRRPQHMVATLREGGHVAVELLGKREAALLHSVTAVLSDHQWHSISIVKSGQRAQLVIDNQEQGDAAILRRKFPLRSPLFVGGLAQDALAQTPEILDSFQGCIGYLEVNGHKLNMEHGQKHALQPCVADIEPAAVHFDGSGFATGSSYHLQEKLDITLELRTSQFSGLLLAFVGAEESLIAELRDGQVVAQVGSRTPRLRAVQRADSTSALCDGRWHTVQLTLQPDSLWLHLDSQAPTQDQSKPALSKRESAQLYMGGLPDETEVPLLGIATPPRLLGCLRKVAINGNPFQWNRAKLFNTFPNACPKF